ncbi:MFS transporter [Kribbella sp. NPDC051620]|uniref:MFS transporter n=1 Tax=Kribbella sp. NPDC051620 TaxID=3364120 RepID=UPI0037AEA47A
MGETVIQKRRAGLYALLTADVFSAFGSRFSVVAIPWLVLITTGSPAKMGLVAAAEMIPYLLTSVLAAPIADRFGMRRTSITCDLSSAVTMGFVAATPDFGFWQLVLLIAVSGGMRGVGDRVKHVLLRPVTAESGIPMIRVTSAYEAMNRTAGLIGAPLAGILVATLGARHTIWLDAGTFLAAAVLVWALVRPAPEPEEVAPAKEPYLTALRGGFSFLRTDKLLLGMIATLFLINFFQQAASTVLLPLWVQEMFGSPTRIGIILGTFAAGSLAGNVVFTIFSTKLPQMLSFFIGAAIGGAPRILVLGLTDSLVVVLVVTFCAGFGIASVNPVVGAILYERIPVELQTRVFGVVAAVAVSGIPIGSALAGVAAANAGLKPTILVGGAVLLALTLIPLLRYRQSSEPPAKEPAQPAGEPG